MGFDLFASIFFNDFIKKYASIICVLVDILPIFFGVL